MTPEAPVTSEVGTDQGQSSGLNVTSPTGPLSAAERKRRPRSRDPASLRPQPKRDGPDFWPTPACLITALLRHVLPTLPRGRVWEFAAGDGRLVEPMRGAGREVIATDLHPVGPGIGCCDFLHDPPPPETCGAVAVTNPPYERKTLNRFIAHGFALLDCGAITAFVLLLRLDKIMAEERVPAFNRAAALWHCSWRPIWIPGTKGNGRWSNVWCCWRRDYQGPPLTRFLQPEDVSSTGDLFADREADP